MVDKVQVKGNDIEAAAEAFPELDWRKSPFGRMSIFSDKKDAYVGVKSGNWIVKTDSGFEVHVKEPEGETKEAPEETTQTSTVNEEPEPEPVQEREQTDTEPQHETQAETTESNEEPARHRWFK